MGLAPSSCLERVRRLRDERRPHRLSRPGRALAPWASPSRPSSSSASIATPASRSRSFRTHALSLREAIAVYHVAGQHDFLVHVGVRDANHLRDLALDAFTSRPEVARIETHLIFEHVPKAQMPVLTETEEPARKGRRRRRG